MAFTRKTEITKLQNEIENLRSQLDGGNPDSNEKTVPTEVLYKWTVPASIFVKRDQKWFVSIAFVILVFILLFAFLQDILPIFVLVALMFIIYLLGTIAPHDVTHEITNKGIYTMDKLFPWKDLKYFWFSKQYDWIKLDVDTKLSFPGRLILLVKENEDKEIFELLRKNLSYYELEKQSWLSRLTDGDYINLENYLPKKDADKAKAAKA